MSDQANALVVQQRAAELAATDAIMRDIIDRKVPAGIAVMMNEGVAARVTNVAERMARANGMTPRHLLGNVNACFAVVMSSLTWQLDPFQVAKATFDVGGKIGYEGKLVQAILEKSGQIVGQIKFIHFGKVILKSNKHPGQLIDVRSNDPNLEEMIKSGDWTEVRRTRWEDLIGKYKIIVSAKNSENKFPVPDYDKKLEEGLGVTVRAQVRGEAEPREFDFLLVQAFPRNSTLWATDPKTQITYTAVRRFASAAAPSLIMGIPFDVDSTEDGGMRDVTPADEKPEPRPVRSTFTGPAVIDAEQEAADSKAEVAEEQAEEDHENMRTQPHEEEQEQQPDPDARWELYDETGESVENFAKDEQGTKDFVNALAIRFKGAMNGKALQTLFDNAPLDLLPEDARDYLKATFSKRLNSLGKSAPAAGEKQGGLGV